MPKLCVCAPRKPSLYCVPFFHLPVFFFKHSSSSKQHVSTTLDPEPYWKPQVLHDRMKLHCVHKQLMQSLKADTMLGSMTNCINQTASREGILCYEHHKKGDDIISLGLQKSSVSLSIPGENYSIYSSINSSWEIKNWIGKKSFQIF